VQFQELRVIRRRPQVSVVVEARQVYGKVSEHVSKDARTLVRRVEAAGGVENVVEGAAGCVCCFWRRRATAAALDRARCRRVDNAAELSKKGIDRAHAVTRFVRSEKAAEAKGGIRHTPIKQRVVITRCQCRRW